MTWFQTFSCKTFEYRDPKPDQIEIRDIAHALGNICRFAGHTKQFYSVAEHSILCSLREELDTPMQQFTALMHDAVEAYINDVPQPLKVMLRDYQKFEENINAAIAEKFGFPAELTPEVKQVDLRMLATERLQIMGPAPQPWHPAIEAAEPYELTIKHWSPSFASWKFIERFYELKEQL